MEALARLLERLLWPSRKEEEAEEEEEEEGRSPDGPQSLLDAPRCAQRPHGGVAASCALSFGASSVQGWRAHMEDAHCAWLALPGVPPGWSFFAVLDGHGAAFLSADARLHALWPRGELGGSTAVALLISPCFLYLTHCGDSRAVLSRAGAVAFSTEDHRPLHPRERERIHDAGGTILRRRLEGSLAVSRALGDFAYKEAPGRPPELQLVSAEPEVTALARQAEDEFMLLASDGVWDAMSGTALAGLVASRLCLDLAPELLCAQLLDTCLCKGSLDNMTCILVCFPGAPRPCEEAIRKELALDAALGHRVAELCTSTQEPPSLNTVFRTLASEDIPDLPPGGGLYCKATVIAEAYSEFCQASAERWVKGHNGAGPPAGTLSSSALDLEA
nr:PREDICTED: LOW QUALITY PROTEIN: probable protein phosphatase 1N [Camelus bactrianus]